MNQMAAESKIQCAVSRSMSHRTKTPRRNTAPQPTSFHRTRMHIGRSPNQCTTTWQWVKHDKKMLTCPLVRERSCIGTLSHTPVVILAHATLTAQHPLCCCQCPLQARHQFREEHHGVVGRIRRVRCRGSHPAGPAIGASSAGDLATSSFKGPSSASDTENGPHVSPKTGSAIQAT